MNLQDWLEKARPHKYISRKPKKGGKGYDYTYADQQELPLKPREAKPKTPTEKPAKPAAQDKAEKWHAEAEAAYKRGREALTGGNLEAARVQSIRVGEHALKAKKAGLSKEKYDQALRARDALLSAYHKEWQRRRDERAAEKPKEKPVEPKPEKVTPKQASEAKEALNAGENNEKVFGLASDVVRAAIPKADRDATLKAAKALLELAKQPGQKGKVLGEIRALSVLARTQAKLINNRYNADRNRDKPPQGRDKLYTYDDVLKARGVRDLLDKLRSKVSDIKAGKKVEKPTQEVKAELKPPPEAKAEPKKEEPEKGHHKEPNFRGFTRQGFTFDIPGTNFNAEVDQNPDHSSLGRYEMLRLTVKDKKGEKIGHVDYPLEAGKPISENIKKEGDIPKQAMPLLTKLFQEGVAKRLEENQKAFKERERTATGAEKGTGGGEAKPKLHKPGDLYPGASIGKNWRVKSATGKTVTIHSPGGGSAGARFVGKSYTYRWDGTGFKRQGEYLTPEGMVPASEFEKSQSVGIDGWLVQADDDALEKSYDTIKDANENKTEEKAMKDDGKPGESLQEVDTEELKQTKTGLEARLKDLGDDPQAKPLRARLEAISGELKRRGGSDMDKGCASMDKACGTKHMTKAKDQPSQDTNLSPEKARQMLHEGSGGHGRPITEQQRKFFGAIGGHLPAPGEKAKKSMDLNDWIEKALPTHEARMGGPKSDVQGGSQDGGDWEGKGKTPDSNGGPVKAAGMDADGNPVGSDPGKQEKLSEDDEDQGEIGKPDKKKPIEKLGKSELYPAPLTPARQRDMVAHDIAKLRKSPEMVTIGPQNHPYGYDRTMGADHEALSKSEGSTDIPTLTLSPGQSLAQAHVLCKSVHPRGCNAVHSAMLTACPECGAGTTQHRIWPTSSEVQVIPVAGPGGLRPAKRAPMVKIQ